MKIFLKKILGRIPIVRLVYKGIKRAIGFSRSTVPSDFPTKPYIFTREDAQRVYSIVLDGNLHHRSGPEVSSLEKEFADYHGVNYALATNAGTSALEMAVKAIGIKPGDEVIVPAYTFVATAQAVLARGGIPVFADIDDTFTVSPISIQEKITKRTKAIVAVHMFGNVSNMDLINSLAKNNKLRVIEDCCQAIDATFRGKKVGSLGDIGCFSFNEKKAITTGQGGMLITNSKKYFEIFTATRETGQIDETLGSDVVTTGNTYALTEMQAALARSILRQLDKLNGKRRSNYELFTESIDTQSSFLRWYRILPQAVPSFSRLVLMIDFRRLGVARRTFIDKVRSFNIPLKTFYPVPLYKYSLFKNRRDSLTRSTFPFAHNMHVHYRNIHLPFVESFCEQQVGIEFSPYLTKEHILYFSKVVSDQIRAHT